MVVQQHDVAAWWGKGEGLAWASGSFRNVRSWRAEETETADSAATAAQCRQCGCFCRWWMWLTTATERGICYHKRNAKCMCVWCLRTACMYVFTDIVGRCSEHCRWRWRNLHRYSRSRQPGLRDSGREQRSRKVERVVGFKEGRGLQKDTDKKESE